ncbi:MAG: hypothetical protein RQM92_04040 [Candidatus Syntrophopropionicum ammoniitolerans]
MAGLIKKGSFDRLYRMNITIRYNDSEVNVMALLDTGNSLKDSDRAADNYSRIHCFKTPAARGVTVMSREGWET